MRAFLGIVFVLLIGFSFQMGGVAETREQATINDTEMGLDEIENQSGVVNDYWTEPSIRGAQTAVNGASLLAYENDWFPGVAVGYVIQLGLVAYGLFKAHVVVKGARSRQ